jgi:predicted TIM-barrel fold metal-dependent hydrolase
MALEFGIAFNEWLAAWWKQAEERVAREASAPAGAGS